MQIYAAAIIALGILALIFPLTAGLSIGIMIGITLVAYGILMIVAGFARRKTERSDVALGCATAIVGTIALVTPLSAVTALVWLTGAWFLLAGIAMLLLAFRWSFGRPWLLGIALVKLICGGVLLAANPITAIGYAASMLGLCLILRGVFLLIVTVERSTAMSAAVRTFTDFRP